MNVKAAPKGGPHLAKQSLAKNLTVLAHRQVNEVGWDNRSLNYTEVLLSKKRSEWALAAKEVLS